MTMTIVVNPVWVAEALAEQQARDALRAPAEEIRDAVNAAVPVVTGSLQAWYEQTDIVDGDGRQVRIEMGVPIGAIIEYGSVNNPPYAPMRTGIEAAGARYQEGGG